MEIWVIGILVFLMVDLLLVVWVFLWKKKSKKFSEKELNYFRAQWIKIIDSFNSHPQHAILDADKLLDQALGLKGFKGNLGEKLKKARFRFSDINGVWYAHKMRNKIAHEFSEIESREAKTALSHFKKALNDLGAKL